MYVLKNVQSSPTVEMDIISIEISNQLNSLVALVRLRWQHLCGDTHTHTPRALAHVTRTDALPDAMIAWITQTQHFQLGIDTGPLCCVTVPLQRE